MIRELRPAMLNYGLCIAIEELLDEVCEQAANGLVTYFDLTRIDFSYDPQFELHLFRIIQQACMNTLRHAHAKTLQIYGRLDPDCVDITIEDDGVGFDADRQLNLTWLLANNHYGLAGMYERAAVIGAQLQIDSSPGEGARVNISWRA